MAKSSINFAKGSSHSFIHNDRAEAVEPDYLLPVEHRLGNECNRSASEAQALFDRWFAEAKENYQTTYGQKFQGKKENGHWEAAINLNKEHTLADVEQLVKEIEKETGFRAMQISIHRDEGHINERGHPIYNLHAHVDFFTFDQDTGRQLYRRSISNSERQRIRKEQGIPDGEPIPKQLTAVMDREKLSKLQDITARELKMERGKKGSDAVHLKPKQKRAVEKEKAQMKEQITDLTAENARLQYSFREMQKQISALEALNAEQKKELHRLNTEINKTKGDNTAKVAELEAKLKEAQKPQHEPINASQIEKLKDEIASIAKENNIPTAMSTEAQIKIIGSRLSSLKEEVKAERSEKNYYADKWAEVHHAYEYEPSTLQPILDRQQVEIAKEPKEAYKSALQRRDEAYRQRMGREPTKSYSRTLK